MATSEITLYKNCKITPDRNAMVDSIDDYLSTLLTTYSNNNFQYQKMELDFDINVPANQSNQGGGLGNYCKIRQDLKNWYFFIIGESWVSESVCKLQLSMDTINTFALESDYYISNKSTIIRKHKDRFKKVVGTAATGYSCINSVDNVPEGLSGITKRRESKDLIGSGDTRLDRNWFLIYDNSISNTIRCRLLPDDGSDILLQKVNNNWYTVPKTAESKFFTRIENGAIEAYCDGTIHYISDWQNLYQFINVIYDNVEDEFKILICNAFGVGWEIQHISTLKLRNVSVYHSDGAVHRCPYLKGVLNMTATTITLCGNKYFRTISNIDRTETTLINIIQCPYCPVEIKWNSNGVIEDGMYEIDLTEECLLLDYKSNDMQLDLEDNLSSYFTTSIDAFTSEDSMKTSAFDRNLETKMMNSEIYEMKYSYGDSSIVLQPELLSYDNSMTSVKNTITYKQTNQLSSEKIFDSKLTQNNNSDDIYQHQADYDNVIVNNRQDSLPIINDNYLTYIRSGGYRYDKESISRQKTAAWFGVGLGVIQTVGGIISAIPTGGVGVAIAISGITTTIASITSALTTTAQLETNLAQKQNDAINQANNISNVSNIDLVNFYDGNKLYRYIYTPTINQQRNIFDLFYYCGYACNKKEEIDMDSTNTRYWFDYIQADVLFERYNKAYDKFTKDIKARYNLGITRVHKHTVGGITYWGWSENGFENWERSKFNI